MTEIPSQTGAAAGERSLEREPVAGGLAAERPVQARPALAGRLSALLLALWSAVLRHPAIWAILLIALITVAPLLQPGYFWGAHDARHDVYFLFEYDRSVLEGNWFPRWGPEWAFGYGYPFWIIYAPLAVFTGEIFHHFGGFDWESSVKAVLALSVVVSGLGMYGFVRSWLGRRAALLAAAVYMLFPYHLVDMFVRAALPESVALAFFPLVLWSLRVTVVRPRAAAVLAGALAYAGLMWTHNLSAVIFTPGLALYLAALIWWQARAVVRGLPADGVGDDHAAGPGHPPAGLRETLAACLRLAWPPLLAVGLGLGLSAGFFIPAAIEGARYVNLTQWFGQYYDPFQHFVYFNQLFNPSWGFGISQPGPDDVALGSLSYQLGAIPFLLALVGLVTAGRLARRLRREIWFWALWGAAAIFLTLGFSAPAWHLPGVPLAQFPWRYLMLAAAPLSVLAGALVAGNNRVEDATEPAAERLPWWPTVILVTLVALSSYPYLKVEMREPTPQQGPVSYQALMRFERTSDEMTGVTAWVDPVRRPHWSDMADIWVNGRQISNRVDYTGIHQDKVLAVNAEGMGTDHEEIWYYTDFAGKSITFNRFWYPGWRAYLLDGKHGKPVRELPIQRENGPLARIVLPVPQGQGYVLLRFENTSLRAAALGVTYATITLMVLGLAVVTGRQLIAGRLRRPLS